MKNIILVFASCFLMMSANAGLEEIFGNAEAGDSCVSDYQCESLCCHSELGSCGDHTPNGEESRSCNKPAGESCIANEFCQKYSVVICKIVKIGYKSDGSIKCDLRCPSVPVQGNCLNKVCIRPVNPPIPAFDPDDCSGAVDP